MLAAVPAIVGAIAAMLERLEVAATAAAAVQVATAEEEEEAPTDADAGAWRNWAVDVANGWAPGWGGGTASVVYGVRKGIPPFLWYPGNPGQNPLPEGCMLIHLG